MRCVVYRHFDKDGVLLYVGCTKDIYKRTMSHVSQKDWAHEIATITLEHYEDRKDALAAEIEYQYKENPKYVLPPVIARKLTREARYNQVLDWLSDEWKSPGELAGVMTSYYHLAVKRGHAQHKRVPEGKYHISLFKKAGK
jgi:predicted GIY-YIG superfamily endonuclease